MEPGARARTTGLLVVAVGGLALAIYTLAFRSVGDYLTESDFYGGYAQGAAALLHGRLDFARYGVYGPVYELALAAVGFVVRDLFTAARLLSVAAALASLLAWWRIAERRFDAGTALGLVTLLFFNPTFVRYGYSVSTDMLSMALFSLSAWATFTVSGKRAPLLAGVLGGLAALTRYNLAAVLPAGMLVELLRAGVPARRRVLRSALVLAGFLLPVLPWTLASLANGHVPGGTLVGDRGFYLQSIGEPAERRYADLGAGVSRDAAGPVQLLPLAGAVAERLGRGLLRHPLDDANYLLGWPAALLALAGVGVALARRRGGRFAPFVPHAVIPYAVLAPVYYTERYSMVIAPLLLLPGAWLVASMAAARRRRPLPALAATAVALAVLVPTAIWAAVYHRNCYEIMPKEARASGEVVRRLAKPGERMLARKAQAAWYAGLEPVPFPDFGTLPTLAAFCRQRGVDWLYYSWYEAALRPSFAFLLDTTVAVPGLRVVHATRRPASVTYRIEPGFGTLPAWVGDRATLERVVARVNALTRPGPRAVPMLLFLATDELARGRPAEALADAEEVLRSEPRNERAQQLVLEARRALGK